MRSRLRSGLALLAVVAAVGALSGCASSSSDKSPSGSQPATGTVTWWEPNWDTPVAKGMVADFEKKNPGITVNMVETTADTLANKVSVALGSGSTPDVITELASRTSSYAAKGQLLDVDSLYGGSAPKSDFLPGSLSDVTYKGKLYAVPYRWDNVSLIYNQDMFKAAGITKAPTTIDELEADAKKLTKGGVSGIGWQLGNNDNAVLRFYGLAASAPSSPAKTVDGVGELNEKSTKQALDVVAGSVRDGWASKSSLESDSTGVRQLFENKQIAMYIGGVYDLTELQQKGMNVGTALAPGFGGPSKTAANGWVYLIPKASKNAAAAKKFVQYMTTPKAMAKLTLTFPARTSAGDDPKFHTALATPFYDQLQSHAIPAPYDPSWYKLEPTLFAQIQAVATGQATSTQAAKTIQQAADAATK